MLSAKEVISKSASPILVITILYLLAVRSLLIFSYSLDLDGAEVVFVHFTQLLLEGKSLYRNPCEFPFFATLYAPGYPYLLYFLSNLFQLNPVNDIHQLLVIARVLSFAAMLVNLYFIFLLLKFFRLSRIYMLAGITCYLLLITGHFYVTRPDSLKTTAFTILLYLAFQYLFYAGKKIHLLLFLLTATAAVCIKQDTVVSVFLLLFLLGWYLKDKKVLYLIVGFAACTALCGLLFHLYLGQHFYTNTFLFNFQVVTDIKNSINIKIVLFSIARNFPLLLLAGVTCFEAFKNRQRKEAAYFIPILALILFLTSHLSMFRSGAYLNYTYDMILLLVINACLFFRNYENYFAKYIKWVPVLLGSYLLVLFGTNIIIHSYTYDTKKENALKENYLSDLKERNEIRAITKNDIIFFQNPKLVVFFSDANLIYGYDMHVDRYVEGLLGLKIKTRLLFFPTEDYDQNFSNGNVQYIISDNTEVQKRCIERYYSAFHIYKLSKHFMVFRYTPPGK